MCQERVTLRYNAVRKWHWFHFRVLVKWIHIVWNEFIAIFEWGRQFVMKTVFLTMLIQRFDHTMAPLKTIRVFQAVILHLWRTVCVYFKWRWFNKRDSYDEIRYYDTANSITGNLAIDTSTQATAKWKWFIWIAFPNFKWDNGLRNSLVILEVYVIFIRVISQA